MVVRYSISSQIGWLETHLDGLDVLLNDGSSGLSADLGSVLLSVGAQAVKIG
jgi:hypothetical protein